MVSSSKILTVSYGTFSCTAEGFEDPLDAVKDATHFFRGVIREDRFFGSEPPQLDAEMAAELFQAQIDARVEQGSLMLRGPLSGGAASTGALSAALAAGPSVMRAPTAAAPSPAAEAVGGEPAAEDPVAERVVAAPEAASVEEETPEAEEDFVESTEDAVALAAAAMAVAAPADLQALFAEASGTMPRSGAAPAALPDTDTDTDTEDDSIEAEVAYFDDGSLPPESDEAAPEVAEPEPVVDEAEAAAARAAEAESVAAKLRRIRAVVEDGNAALAARKEETPAQEASPSSVLDSLGFEPGKARRDNLFSDTLASVAYDDDDDEEIAEPVLPEGILDSLGDAPEAALPEDDAALPEAAAVPEQMPEAAEAPEEPGAIAEPDAPAAEVQDAPAPRRVRVVKVKRAVFDEAVASGRLEEVEETADSSAPASSLSPEEEDDLARELAAVKAELSADLASAWDDEEDDESEATPEVSAELDAEAEAEPAIADEPAPADEPVAAAPHAKAEDEDRAEDALEDWGDDDWTGAWDDDDGWGDDDEADEVDKVAAAAPVAPLRLRETERAPEPVEPEENDLAAGDDAEQARARETEETARKAVKMSSAARAMLTENRIEDNDASRILDETNTQLDEPEGNRRRSAIAHLRAAVAATRADKLLGRKAADAEEAAEPYRADLANVVRPRRPEAGVTQTERPSESLRPAPLKLVAEQRVDAQTPAEPPRPRRVRVADLEEEAAAENAAMEGGFEAYAAQVGASELPELLEAAAAYLSYVEGREQFSRPQLMTRVRQVEAQVSTREDRLRSFGQLLREGKIEKTRGGRFTASDRISFKPGERAAG
ncbi:hypothetical protein [Salipiger mucosus]|uniref:CPN protein n=1 Tax=Salipiger mucosus DSM 16094 TaxID=1123237 RepID=S9RPL5_9RHOB|nr:hypothetical protein [Salipiger mucosus]EPX75974.1 CPN protein [Salipiger mucosus DSM 16094]